MADTEVVILEKEEEAIIDLDELNSKVETKQTIEQKPKKSKKWLFISLGVVVLILVLALLLILLSKKDEIGLTTSNFIDEIQRHFEVQKFSPSKIDNMIQRANELYERGDKLQALKIYENIAIYNESLSNYNLGVSQMGQGRCQEAIESFKNAIVNRENASVSAINAAVCSLELNNKELFDYYIGVAGAFLTNEADSPIFNYYNALIFYYKGQYLEALKSLNKSKFYIDEQKYLASKIASFLSMDTRAIKELEEIKGIDVSLPLGLLYARIGKFDIAKNKLYEAMKNDSHKENIELALAFINLKTGLYQSAGEILDRLHDDNASFVEKTYPIKVVIKPEFLNINLAQKNFQNAVFFDETKLYETIFYFVPYRAFDAKQNMDYIRKGGISAFVDDHFSANEYLKTGGLISKINANLSKTIVKALNYELKQANLEFKKMVEIYSEHAILHYNLALSYAQLSDFSNAYKHFLTSYHLEPNNHLAGIYAVMSAKLINKDTKKLVSEILDGLNNHKGENQLAWALLHLVLDNQTALLKWLDESSPNLTPLGLVLDIAVAKKFDKTEILNEKFAKLKEILPNDIMVNMLIFIYKFDNQNVKEYAREIQYNFYNKLVDRRAFYSGANIIRHQYVKLLQIGGLLHIERDFIKEEIKKSVKNPIDMLQTLAYLDIFSRDYEESYTIYNELIDQYKISDAYTLFLAAVASIGANHTENAIALLELSKLTSPGNFEVRYGLGLLYQEIKNIKGATIEYRKIGNIGEESKFFSFEILH